MKTQARRGSDSRRGILPIFAALIAYAIYYSVFYASYIVPRYGSQGFEYRAPEDGHYAVGFMITVIAGLALPRRIQHVSDFTLWLLYVIVVAPTVLTLQLSPFLSPGRAMLFGFHLAACLILARILTAARPALHLEYAAVGLRRISPVLCALFVFGIFVYLLVADALSLQALGIYDVYGQRARFAELTAGSLIAGLLVPIYFNAVGPMLMALCLYRRRYALFLLPMGLQVLLYTTVGFKSVLYGIAGVVAFHFLVARRQFMTGFRFLAASAGAAMTVSVVGYLIGSDWLTELLVRRLIFVPGMLNSVYASVFWSSDGTLLGDAAANVVAREHFHENFNPSASLWANGFGSFGFVGMYAVTLALVVVLWVADEVTKTLPLVLGLSVFLMPSLALAESSLLAALLSHSVVAALVVALLTPRPQLRSSVPPDESPPAVARHPDSGRPEAADSLDA